MASPRQDSPLAQLQRLAIAPEQIQENQIWLTPDQQHYLGRVLRLQAGDRFIALDGRGQWWLATLSQNPSQAMLLAPLTAQTELPLPVTLLAALPKGNGFDQVVRCSTELGVTRIVPLLSDRTLLQPGTHKLDRWRRIAQEATEQSQRQQIPEISPPLPFLESLPLGLEGARRYLCVTDPTAPPLLQLLQIPPIPSEILVAIGPEGGWTVPEEAAAIAAGYQPVSLGRRILRSVTAPLAALALIATTLECLSHPTLPPPSD